MINKKYYKLAYYNFVKQRNATQRNATQRNATQRIPQLYLNNNFKFHISQFFKAFNFLSVCFVLQNIFSFVKNSSSLSFAEGIQTERGFEKSATRSGSRQVIYSNLDCFSNDYKNNSVKTFLTSITFDSLSRKIKIPCLVIKILSKKEEFNEEF